MNEILIGADPEIFVGIEGKFISAHGLVEGTKLKPYKVNKGAVQVDGMALEFNIDPAKNLEEFNTNLEVVKDQLEFMIGDKEFIKNCSVFFDENFTKNIPRQNLELGCMPDFNAYTMDCNETPNPDTLMRTAGGHIHIGPKVLMETIEEEESFDHYHLAASLAKAMDKYVGVYSLLWDHDDKRRSLYGKAGSFRPKPYGMEYRTLSNAWIFSKSISTFVYRQTIKAVDSVLNGESISTDFFRNIINNSDRDNNLFKDNTSQELGELIYG